MEKENLGLKIGIVFYLASMIGYVYELILNLIFNGKIFSHGFLKGPWLPIYGFGALLILLINKFQKQPLVIFFLSFFITGFLEGISGYLLLKIFKMRLWDYTGKFLNIGGFVCFLSAFCFGIGGLLVTYILYPLVQKLLKKVNNKDLTYILTLITVIFSLDLIHNI